MIVIYSCCEVHVAIVMQPTLRRTNKDVSPFAKNVPFPELDRCVCITDTTQMPERIRSKK